jgi:hypothetical protein
MKKNTFILQTIEPSQVYLVKSSNVLWITSKALEYMEHYGSGTNNLHVYITNKDPYDRGDWCIDIETEDVFKVAEVKEFSGIVRSDTDTYIYDACAKIVLTTDLKLVADEVAEIDIEFLRLLKGKKLDEIGTVEVKKTPLLSNNGRALYGYKYTAIIPPKQELSVRLNNSLNQFNLSLEDAINTEPSKLKEIGFGNRSIIELQDLKQEPKQKWFHERKILEHTVEAIPKKEILADRCNAYEFIDFDKQAPDQCKNPLDCGKVYNEELTTQTITCTKCGNTHTFPFSGDYYCPSQKKETLQENAKRILANNIDGLRDALQDDDLFFFYKGVIQCYGEAMAKWQKKHRKKSVPLSDLEDGYQQELFNYLHSELDVIALQSQMHDIERIVDSMPSKNIYSEADMREMYNKSCGLIGLGELNDQTENNNRFRELIEKIKKK